jgi:23S rRNA (uracil1939-C5)-methyltransferase
LHAGDEKYHYRHMSETITVTIEKLVEGGKGLARHGSQVVFVPAVIPAETVRVIGGAQHKGFQEARVRDVLVASPDRVAPPCPVYESCGGCQFQHLRYEAQLVQKAGILKETLNRIGKLAIADIPAVIPSPNPYGYRNAVRLAVFPQDRRFRLGFHREGAEELVAAAGCLLVPEALRTIILQVDDRLGALPRLPVELESVEFRHSLAFGSTLLIYHIAHIGRTGRAGHAMHARRPARAPRPGPAQQEASRALFRLGNGIPNVVGQIVTARQGERRPRIVEGQDWIADRLDDLLFRISDRSFAQANWALNETLSRTLTEWVGAAFPGRSGVRVLELYAGIGTLGLPLARHGALVTEVEANPYALADARHAAKVNHIGRTRFRPLRAEAMLESLKPDDYDAVIVDPPRTGLSPECVQSLGRLQFPHLFYLSCDAPTLARDLGRLGAGGYRIARVQPFDMFPQTAHLETLVELTRGESKSHQVSKS